MGGSSGRRESTTESVASRQAGETTDEERKTHGRPRSSTAINQGSVVMTRGTDNTVRLSLRDWAGLAALALGLLGTLTAQYLRHDRLLTELLVRQAATSERVQQVERAVERLEGAAMVEGTRGR